MKRNFGLDMLRTVSIWLVLISHAGITISGLKIFIIGGIGVEVFFVLSGFLIGGIILREIDSKKNTRTTLLRFWTRRWLRILPLYYGILLFKFFFIDHSVSWNLLYYFFFLQNNFFGISFLGVSWSLVVEEWFYLVVPIFLIASTKILKTERRIFPSLLLFLVFINIIRYIYVVKGNVPYTGVNSNPPFRFDSLFLGVTLAFLKQKWRDVFNRMQSLLVCLLGMAIFIAYICYCWNLEKMGEPLFPRTLGFFVLPLSITLMLPYFYTIKSPTKTFLGKAICKFVTTTSLLTYAIYLVHGCVYYEIFKSKYLHGFFVQWGASLVLIYFVAWIIYTFFEKPILRYRNQKFPELTPTQY